MECGGGELSDSGSSGYWSWDHGNVSPAPSPSVTEMDSSPDEGLQMELEQGEELHAKKPKVWRSTLSPGCVLRKAESVSSVPLCTLCLSVCLLIFCLTLCPVLCGGLSLTELFQRCV